MQLVQATPKIFIALPAYGQIVTAQTVSSLMSLSNVLFANQLGGGFGTLSFPDISEIRNIFLTVWYDKVQTSHMLFIDADMGFDPQLIVDMIAFNKPLVGALCPKRKLPVEFAGRARTGNCQVINGFMEVDGIGGAVMLIRRDAVDAILKAEPHLSDEVTIKNHAAKELLEAHGVKRLIRAFDKVVRNGETFSEDLSFCFRWKDAAPEEFRNTPDKTGEVWANIMHPVTHVGPHEYTARYYDHIKDFMKPNEPALEVPMEAVAEMMPVEQLQAAE